MNTRERAISSITQARSELDRALAELDRLPTFDPALVGLVAHALGNYITVTTATIEILRQALHGHPDPDVHVWLEGIGHAADLMQHSVGRLVSASPPRDFPLKLDAVKLTVMVERACEYYRRRTPATRVHIVCTRARDVPQVWADRVALAVIVDNLLSNALRHSPPQGRIDVEVAAEPAHVVCSVADAGPGLSAEDQSRVLTGAPPDPERAGTPPGGFGLIVVREFLRRMDGELWCESQPGAGARFLFRLPAVE